MATSSTRARRRQEPLIKAAMMSAVPVRKDKGSLVEAPQNKVGACADDANLRRCGVVWLYFADGVV